MITFGVAIKIVASSFVVHLGTVLPFCKDFLSSAES